MYIIPARDNLVSDIPAGDGNIEKLFYGVLLITWYRPGSEFYGQTLSGRPKFDSLILTKGLPLLPDSEFDGQPHSRWLYERIILTKEKPPVSGSGFND